MTIASMILGSALSSDRTRRRFGDLTPVMGVTGVLFGCWYALGAVAVVPYAF